jgi:homoserine kinase
MKLRLPATSANLGPGFDALAMALQLYLSIDAEVADSAAIVATGRNAEICSATENNLLLDTYAALLARERRPLVPLRIEMQNEIPLGMGCGSSAAVRLAAVVLASHFGKLGWNGDRILAEASRLEGHPDNAAACWLGGFVASAFEGDTVRAISLAAPKEWRAVIAMPQEPLGTHASRGFLPESWTRKDVVENLQRVGLLTAAFATGKAEMIATAMGDRLHQPYRSEACPLLPRLLPLSGKNGIAGVALSGAGPAVLMLTTSEENASAAVNLAGQAVEELGKVEFLICELENEPVQREGRNR